ncbi:hypothetical protein [Alicyclobacillus herbarius]|uniref:hypothetical protein n=1 Tax=Alicyclobacillus herbarius TaxID=122960 RepID=UPI000685245B|nr:hypothetical protein [Alicyclobacillus herbarius]
MCRLKWAFQGGAVTALVLGTSWVAGGMARADSPTPQEAVVTVNASAPLTRVPKTALGVNTAVWDGHLTDKDVPSMLRKIGARMLRYPGGSTSDVYHWQTNTVDFGGWANPNSGFDAFMRVTEATGASPIITVNGGTGTAAEAAAWVKDANVTHDYHIRYWEIGNELYGNWEGNGHNFNGNPEGYAEKASQFMKAMKAVDPSIQIGVDLIAPGTGDDTWNARVLAKLRELGTEPDFGIVHWYPQNPGGESDAGLLASTEMIATVMDTLKRQLGHIPVFVTETNSVSSNPGKQTTSLVNALFLADDMADWLQAGAVNVDWWDLHNGIVTASQGANIDPGLYGSSSFGDYGLLANGSSADGISEPTANTPFPSYYAYELLARMDRPGATLVGAGSSDAEVAAHAAKLPNGELVVLLINKDPNRLYHVKLHLEGYRAEEWATVLSYGEGSHGIETERLQDAGLVELPPYSLREVILTPRHCGAGYGAGVSATTTVSSPTVKPSYTETITARFKAVRAQLRGATVSLEVYNPAGELVGRKLLNGVSLHPGDCTGAVTMTWEAPNVPGTYTVRAFAFSRDGVVTYLADESAGQFTVTEPDPIVQGDVTVKTMLSASTVKVGTPVTVSTTYKNTSDSRWLSNGILNQYVYRDGTWVTQFAKNGTLAPGETVTETATFTPSSAGTYTFPVGLFTSNWGFLQWFANSDGPTLTVTE